MDEVTREITHLTKADYRQLRRVIVEHEIAPATLLQRMASVPAEAAEPNLVSQAEHPLHATVTPIGRVRARKDR
jgi:hypothetical protein